MQQQNLGIEDGSNDRRYFTIIPNYVLNHSTIWDREVYIQMKRIAGEKDTCWMSIGELTKKCGMSRRRLQKSIKYLLEHEWIKFIGQKTISTKGGAQYVNEYKITDLWNLNNQFYQEKYKGSAHKTPPLTQRVCTEDIKGGAQDDDKEEPLLNKNPIILAAQSAADIKLNDLIELFKPVNPSYERIYANTTQRSSLERMVKKHGADKIRWVVEKLPIINRTKYAPTVTTPYQLELKLGDIIAFFQKKKSEIEGNKIPTL